MINRMQATLIKKDLKNITSNKRLFSVLLIVPLVLTIFMPSIFVLSAVFVPEDTGDFDALLELLPAGRQHGDLGYMIIDVVLNNIMPLFFLMIPIMAASVMAASSFVGEKEKRTLETLLYCPLSLREIFIAKILASFTMSMAVSLSSFLVMLIVIETEIRLITGGFIGPDISWLAIMLLVSPALSLIAIILIVRGSAKAQTMEESQQRSVFLILPIILLVVGQFSGVMLVNIWVVLVIGVVLAVIAAIAMRYSFGKFNYETLLM